MSQKDNRKKAIRYARWLVKVVCLVLLVLPVVYLAGAPDHNVYSAISGLNEPLFSLPYGQSVCVVWTYAYSAIGPAAWLVCPVGGLQTLVTGQVTIGYLYALLIAVLLFLLPVLLLGNFFCSWICPVGSIIDAFDRFVATFMHGLDAKRQARLQRSKEKRAAQKASLPTAACPTCPITRIVNNRFGGAAANSILLASLVGSAVLQFPVFCAVCPIGITTRGMFHLKAWTFLTHTLMPIILELSIIPIVAVLLSLREKRYWCRKICPVGATLNFVGSASPFLKPTVNRERCVVHGCPADCKDGKLGYCAVCRAADQKICEKVCPQGINLVQGESLARCTKCMECYIQCDRGAVQVQVVGRSELYDAFKDWFKRVHKKVVG